MALDRRREEEANLLPPQYAAALVASIAYTANAIYGSLAGFRLGRGDGSALKHARINLISAGVIGFALGATPRHRRSPDHVGIPAVSQPDLPVRHVSVGRALLEYRHKAIQHDPVTRRPVVVHRRRVVVGRPAVAAEGRWPIVKAEDLGADGKQPPASII